MSKQIKGFYEFGDFRFDIGKRVLWHRGEMVSLAPKATDVLSLLLEQRGNLVERQEIIEKVWSDTFVEEGNLNHAISALRKVLGNELIQTVPRRGYRFTATATEVSDGVTDGFTVERRISSFTTIEESGEISAVRPIAEASRTILTNGRLIMLTVAAVLLIAGAIWFTRDTDRANLPVPKDAPKTLAILPLRALNQSDGGEFGLGITENLASRLGSLEQLTVRPTISTQRIAETESDPLAIGSKLGADAVLEGSYQIVDGRIRMSVRLLDVADGSQIWSGNFDEAESDVFKLQDSLAAQAAKYLINELTTRQQQQIAKRPTENVDAYKLYIRGRYAWNKRTPEALTESVRLFQQALDLDPTFALAYAGLADSYAIFADYSVESVSDAAKKTKSAAMRALEIDPELVEPRTALAYVLATHDWDFAGAEREYRDVIARRPTYATAHQWYGEMLYTLKRFKESEVELRRAEELDPLVPIIRSEIGVMLYYSRDYDGAIAHYAKLKKDFPEFRTPYLFTAWAFDQKNMPEETFREEITFLKLQGMPQEKLDELTVAFQTGGRNEFLENLVKMYEDPAAVPTYRLVHAYARLRDREKTLHWLEKGVEQKTENIVKAAVDPNFDFLKGDPRYEACLKRMNIRS